MTKAVKRVGKEQRRIRMHIENVSSYHSHVQIELPDYKRIARRYPELARRVDLTIGWDYERFDKHMQDTEVLVFMGLDFNSTGFAARAPKLRWIQMTSAGVDHVMPFDWLPPRVIVTNNSGVHAQKHGEFGITAVLMLNNNVPAMTTNQRSSKWHTVFGTAISGKTVTIVGVGSIGGAVAEYAKKLGMRVLGVRRGGAKNPHVDVMYKPSQMARAIAQADFLVSTLPLTVETKNLVDSKMLNHLKRGAGVVNLGRAATMDYKTLVAKLQRGELSGAVIDAHDPEPLPAASPLWKAKNLIVSPHCTSSALDTSKISDAFSAASRCCAELTVSLVTKLFQPDN